MTIKHTRRMLLHPGNRLTRIFWSSGRRKFLTVLLLCTLFGVVFLFWLSRDLPSFERLENITPELATQVYSADGVLIKEFYTEKRFYTPLGQMPPVLIEAVLATEDHRFYDHWGVVPVRVLQVIVKNITTLSKQQGASTLTQQLARRLFLTPQKTLTRKLKEMLTALQIEHTYTKPEIMEMYLNHMSFGHGTYGVESAAQHFFGKHVYDLNLQECALLIGMAQRPAALNPHRHSERALRRRNVVLSRMLAEGFITRETYDLAAATELGVLPLNKSIGIAPYFNEYLRQNLQKEYGWDLYKGGMKIYATLDSRVQACADSAVAKFLPELQAACDRHMRKKTEFSKIVPPSMLKERTIEQILADKALSDSLLYAQAAVQVMLVALNPQTGHILAMIGGRDFDQSQFNRAVQAIRQPGSIFKPFVYTAAIDNGYMPSYEKLNQPIVVHMVDGTRWTPQNYDGSIGGKTTLREALRKSLNLVTARLVQEDVPPEQVIRYARNLGITTPLDAVDAIALGSSGVIPMEVVSAFSVFANQGVLVSPFSVLRVEDRYGNILERAKPVSKGVLREETAYIMADLLKTAAMHGTGAGSRSVYGFMRPAGGKTGTTNNYTDAWYITFTPQIVVGVWTGLDNPALSLGNGQSGARAALPIAATFMRTAHDTLQLPVADFVRPFGVVDVEICADSKKLVGESCPSAITEIFDERYVPQTHCDLHTGQRQPASEELNSKKRRIRF
ncbi:PBP1A family penicillin-binding protein [candidate division KSB1 bacterium]|nr:PBP1A family penicillin-binding protein [candidate division KSB1 bacterium]